jgi:hypothetical protein
MKNLVYMGVALAVLSALGGCGRGGNSAAEGLVNEQLKLMNDLAATLDGIKDDAGAEAAVPKLEQTAQAIRDLEKKAGDTVGAEEKKKLEEQYKAKLDEAYKRIRSAAAAVQAPGKVRQIEQALAKVK